MAWIGGWAVGFFARSRRRRESSKRSSSSKKPTITKREQIIPSVAYFAINKDIESGDIISIIEQAVKHSYAHRYDELEVKQNDDGYFVFDPIRAKKFDYEKPEYFSVLTISARKYSDYDILYINISPRAFSQVNELVFLDYFDRYIEPILYDRNIATKEDGPQ